MLFWQNMMLFVESMECNLLLMITTMTAGAMSQWDRLKRIVFVLNLDKADDKVTCIARARERVRAMRETEERASISLADKQ